MDALKHFLQSEAAQNLTPEALALRLTPAEQLLLRHLARSRRGRAALHQPASLSAAKSLEQRGLVTVEQGLGETHQYARIGGRS